jgi:hypothetical protein
MNPERLAAWFMVAAGAFVAGSEVVDLFIDERTFTTDHFWLGAGLLGYGSTRTKA